MPSTASIFLTTSFPGASMRSFDAGDHVEGPDHDIGGAHQHGSRSRLSYPGGHSYPGLDQHERLDHGHPPRRCLPRHHRARPGRMVVIGSSRSPGPLHALHLHSL
jgi:hypothetical protein